MQVESLEHIPLELHWPRAPCACASTATARSLGQMVAVGVEGGACIPPRPPREDVCLPSAQKRTQPLPNSARTRTRSREPTDARAYPTLAVCRASRAEPWCCPCSAPHRHGHLLWSRMPGHLQVLCSLGPTPVRVVCRRTHIRRLCHAGTVIQRAVLLLVVYR